MKENLDYKFRPDIESLTRPIEILTGRYKGLIFKYGAISIDEKNLVLRFHYDIIQNIELDPEKDPAFHTFLGDLLQDFLINDIGYPEELNDREDYTSKSYQE